MLISFSLEIIFSIAKLILENEVCFNQNKYFLIEKVTIEVSIVLNVLDTYDTYVFTQTLLLFLVITKKPN